MTPLSHISVWDEYNYRDWKGTLEDLAMQKKCKSREENWKAKILSHLLNFRHVRYPPACLFYQDFSLSSLLLSNIFFASCDSHIHGHGMKYPRNRIRHISPLRKFQLEKLSLWNQKAVLLPSDPHCLMPWNCLRVTATGSGNISLLPQLPFGVFFRRNQSGFRHCDLGNRLQHFFK